MLAHDANVECEWSWKKSSMHFKHFVINSQSTYAFFFYYKNYHSSWIIEFIQKFANTSTCFMLTYRQCAIEWFSFILFKWRFVSTGNFFKVHVNSFWWKLYDLWVFFSMQIYRCKVDTTLCRYLFFRSNNTTTMIIQFVSIYFEWVNTYKKVNQTAREF